MEKMSWGRLGVVTIKEGRVERNVTTRINDPNAQGSLIETFIWQQKHPSIRYKV